MHSCGTYCVYVTNWLPSGSDDLSYNNVFNAVMLSRDSGEIYSIQTLNANSTIHNNWLHDTQSLYTGPADNFALPGVYLDSGVTGWTVEQNLVWNNQNNNIFLNAGAGIGGVGANTTPENNIVANNSVLDINATGYIWLNYIGNCGTTQVTNNLIFVPIQQQNTSPLCTATNNSSTAPGATQMTSSIQVGCNFLRCSSEGPPATSGSSSPPRSPYSHMASQSRPVNP